MKGALSIRLGFFSCVQGSLYMFTSLFSCVYMSLFMFFKVSFHVYKSSVWNVCLFCANLGLLYGKIELDVWMYMRKRAVYSVKRALRICKRAVFRNLGLLYGNIGLCFETAQEWRNRNLAAHKKLDVGNDSKIWLSHWMSCHERGIHDVMSRTGHTRRGQWLKDMFESWNASEVMSRTGHTGLNVTNGAYTTCSKICVKKSEWVQW